MPRSYAHRVAGRNARATRDSRALIQGKLDVSGPAVGTRELHKAWPGSQFVLVDDKGHGGPKMNQAMMAAIAALNHVA